MNDSFIKEAITALRRHLMQMPAQQRVGAIAKLPGEMQQTQAYKELGGRAANVVRSLPTAAGHGAPHVFGVARQARGILSSGSSPAPQQVQRQATMGALLHDVTRTPAFHQERQMGKAEFAKHPELFHSNTGAAAAKGFLGGQNAPLTRMARINPQNVATNVQAHDTDAWKSNPALKQRIGSSRSAHAIYAGDKLEGLGAKGFDRTRQVGIEQKETPRQTADFALKQMRGKYKDFIKAQVPVEQQPAQRKRLAEYGREALKMRRANPLVPAAPQAVSAAPMAKVSSFGGAAKAIKAWKVSKGLEFKHPPFVRLLQWAAKNDVPDKQVMRIVGKVIAQNKNKPGIVADLIGSAFKVAPKHRARFVELFEPLVMKTNFKKR